MRYFNSIVEAAEMLGVNTQVMRWLLESGYVLGEYSRGRWSIPVDNLMQKKENGSLLFAIQTAEYKLKPRRHRRSRHNYRQRKTHRSFVKA